MRRRSKRDVRRSKLRTAVYPPRMAPVGLKLGENAFQTIPDVSFFDVNSFFLSKFFLRILVIDPWFPRFGKAGAFWASPSNSPRKMTPFRQKFKSLRSLAKGFKDDWSFFPLILDQNWFTVFAPPIIWWSDDMMIWRYDDMVSWHHEKLSVGIQGGQINKINTPTSTSTSTILSNA